MSINLIKGAKIDLSKEAGGSIGQIYMALGWDAAKGESVDLDASCVMIGTNLENKGLFSFITGATKEKPIIKDTVYFGKLNSSDGSVSHTGDNLTGAGDGDDEVISVDLNKVPADIQALVFTVNSYKGQKFNVIENAYCRVIDRTNSREICKFNLSDMEAYTALVIAKIYRRDGTWKMAALGNYANGSKVQNISDAVLAVV